MPLVTVDTLQEFRLQQWSRMCLNPIKTAEYADAKRLYNYAHAAQDAMDYVNVANYPFPPMD